MDKCEKCGMPLNNECIFVWKCNKCGKAVKLNLEKLHKIQELKKQRRDKRLLKCSACGSSLDDGDENIICKCSLCGKVSGGNLEYFVSGKEKLKGDVIDNDSTMITCPECGGKVLVGLTICNHCGYPFDEEKKIIKCPKCGEEVTFDAKFCNKCGCLINEGSARNGLKKRTFFAAFILVIIILSVASGLHFKEGQRKEEQKLATEISYRN